MTSTLEMQNKLTQYMQKCASEGIPKDVAVIVAYKTLGMQKEARDYSTALLTKEAQLEVVEGRITPESKDDPGMVGQFFKDYMPFAYHHATKGSAGDYAKGILTSPLTVTQNIFNSYPAQAVGGVWQRNISGPVGDFFDDYISTPYSNYLQKPISNFSVGLYENVSHSPYDPKDPQSYKDNTVVDRSTINDLLRSVYENKATATGAGLGSILGGYYGDKFFPKLGPLQSGLLGAATGGLTGAYVGSLIDQPSHKTYR